jgi:3-oxoacyl-[acyl-carrier protein] reductase
LKTSLVVGGTRGIGSVITNQLRKRGDHVITASRRKSDETNHFSFDISSDKDVNEVASSFSSKLGRINYLVFSHRYRGDDNTEEFQVTIDGTVKLINSFQKLWSSESSIVIIGSNASRFVLDEQPAHYHASRSALEGIMKYFAVTFGSLGVRCNCIMPTTIIKPENKDFFTEDNNVRIMIENITPLRRMGKAEDIANLVEFLCSERSSFITGQSFFVDGGISLVGQESLARKLTNLEHSK